MTFITTVHRQSPQARQPPDFKIPLKEHQLAMLQKCQEIEKTAMMSSWRMGFMADPVSAGKCFAKGTRVVLFSGESIAVEEIRVGDWLMGDDSTPRRVLALGSGQDDMYEIRPDEGQSYTVNSEHILCLLDASGREVCMSVRSYLESGQQLRGYRRGVYFPEAAMHKCGDPYIYGKTFGDLDPSHELPSCLIINSRDVRLQVLAGVLDSKGWALDDSYMLDMTWQPALVQIARLARSLGFHARAQNLQLMIWGGGLHTIPLRSLRRMPTCDKLRNQAHTFDVNYKGVDTYYGFELDGNKKFLVEDFIVTHNTAVAIAMPYCERLAYRRPALNIFIVPQNICMQWKHEIDKFAGDTLKVLMVTDYSSIATLQFSPSAITDYDIVLTTPNYFATLANFCEKGKVNPRRVVVDEADTVANMVSQKIPGAMTWFVSATIDRLPAAKNGMVQVGRQVKTHEDKEGKVDEDSALLGRKGGVLRAEECGTYEVPRRLLDNGERICRCDAAWVAEAFSIPPCPTQQIVVDNCIMEAIFNLFYQGLLTAKQLESANARDFAMLGVGDEDDFKLMRTLHTHYKNRMMDAEVTLSAIKSAMHLEQRASECQQEIDRCTKYTALIRQELSRFMFCQATFEQLARPDRSTNEIVNTCYMCVKCEAGHCASWYNSQAQKACVRCGSLEPMQVRSLPNPFPVESKISKLAEIIRELIPEKPRIMVFAKYTQSFAELRRVLADTSLVIKEADAGTVATADKMLTAFKQGNIDVLLAESSLFCSGMNLPEVTDVCFLHAVHPFTVQQIAGRAQRPGRTSPCRIWTFLHVNETK